MDQHFLQSPAWEKFQNALGNETIRKNDKDWEYLAIVEQGNGMIRLYCPYGPTVGSLDALDEALASLKAEARQIGASFVRVQPYGLILEKNEFKPRHLRPIQYSQPEATRVVDLTPSFEDIVLRMSQSRRSVCRNYQKKGLHYWNSRNPHDIQKLLPLLHDVADRNRISVHEDKYLLSQAESLMPSSASLHFISKKDEVVTGALLFEDETTNYYAHAGTAAKHYKLQANTALVGEMLAYSKNQGKQKFDLYGVSPEGESDHPWAGVTAFKTGFGGDYVPYNPTSDIPVNRLRYGIYHALRSLRKRFE